MNDLNTTMNELGQAYSDLAGFSADELKTLTPDTLLTVKSLTQSALDLIDAALA